MVVASTSGRQNLYVYALDAGPGEPSVLRQITSTAGPKSSVQWSPNNREVWYLDGGQIRVASIDGAPARDVTVIAPMDVDFAAERAEVGRQAWRYLRLNFFDPNFHGVDWDKVRETYFPRFAAAAHAGRAAPAHRADDRRAGRVPPRRRRQRLAGDGRRLGLQFDRQAYESSGHFRVAEVIPYGPAAVAGIKAGDYLLSVDGEPLARARTSTRCSTARSAGGSRSSCAAAAPPARGSRKSR